MVAVPVARSAASRLRLLRALKDLAAHVVRPHRAALSNLVAIPLTTFGLGAIDTGVFYASSVAGWIVTGLSLVLLEHLIADE